MQAFDLCALRREVISLAISRAPLIQVMQLLRGGVDGQLRVGGEVNHQAKHDGQCHNQHQHKTVKQTHSNAPCKNFYSLMP